MKSENKNVCFRLLLLAAILAVTPVSARSQGTGKGAERPAAVVVIAAKKQPFFDSVEALGTLRANESVVLTAAVTEIVTAVNFTDGQRVNAGDVLVEMTSEEEKAQLAQERATVAEARRQLERIEPLVRQGASSEALLDTRRREYETAKARLLEIESRLKDHLLVAPFSGVLGLRNISSGALVRPGDPVVTLDDDSVMKLDFSIPSVFLASLEPGMPVEAMAREFGGRIFRGKVSSIDSRIDPVTRSITVRALIPNEDRALRPGLLMAVKLQSSRRESIILPEKSLIPEGRENYVFVIDETQNPPVAEKTKITVGVRRAEGVEVTGGIEEGDLVVTHGTMSVRDGLPASILARQEKSDESLHSILEKADTVKAGK